ncbi:MAG TPA: hypothetical protein VIM59_19990 [Cellvibrio sp.]
MSKGQKPEKNVIFQCVIFLCELKEIMRQMLLFSNVFSGQTMVTKSGQPMVATPLLLPSFPWINLAVFLINFYQLIRILKI